VTSARENEREPFPTPYDHARPLARRTSYAIERLIEAARKRSKTIQLMPSNRGVRFEIIDVATGDYDAMVFVTGEGVVWLREGGDPS